MISDALGMPLAFSITGGEKADCSEALGLLEQCKYDDALMDKADDRTAMIAYMESTGAVAVIPGRSNRKVPRDHDQHIYKERHTIGSIKKICFSSF